ncbi:MAG: SH3 domain-containing protein [Candidatus Methylomirabilia bacterium]
MAAVPAKGEKLERAHQELQESVAEQTVAYLELEEKITTIQVRLLEKEVQINELQKRLDEAIQEVVRAKAKLPGLESQAEAASVMAEAEIALKALRASAVARENGPEVIRAEHLLKMSAQEYEQENYGGALYLASQAKGFVNAGRGQSMSREKMPMKAGEVLFALPLSLEVLETSNIREGPGLDFQVLFTVEKGALLVGYSYKDQWVRVNDEDGRGGWIFHTLVGGRQHSGQ